MPHNGARRVRWGVVGVALAIVLGAASGIGMLGPRRASAATGPPTSVSLTGHGWGHGIGMGQWGALGYALGGQSYSWILDHYYGGTKMATVGSAPVRVRMVENDGNDVIVTSGAPFTAAGASFGAGQGVLLRLTSTPDTWAVFQGPGCAGPWTQIGTATDNGGAGPAAQVTPSVAPDQETKAQALQVCMASGNIYLRGSIAAAQAGGVARTVNVLPIEQYLRGVVPSESPAYWGTIGGSGPQGQPAGFQALETQAVAARTYVAVEEASAPAGGGSGAYGYADICDTPSCQVYGGIAAENQTSDQAVAGTAGQIRQDGSGNPAFTQYSSSTGGWTAGGAFPAVVDDGDSVCTADACNPNHNWTVQVPASAITSAYPGIGQFESLQVTSRSGPAQADQGGRVVSMTVQGSTGSTTTSGDTFAARLGLKSDWFAVTGVPSGGLDGYWMGAGDGGVFSFGAASFHGSTGGMRLNQPVVGMAGTPSGGGYWLVASDGGVFTFGDAAFYGSTGALRLAAPIVGMAPTPDGKGYWLVASDGGVFTFGDATFYGCGVGTGLTAAIVGMTPTPSGTGYWLAAADGSIRASGDAHSFGPGPAPDLPVAGLARTPDGGGYWLLSADGTVSAYGDAVAHGSVTLASGDRAVAIVATTTGNGYLVAERSGRVQSFGDAPNYGGVPDQVPGYPGGALALVGRAGS